MTVVRISVEIFYPCDNPTGKRHKRLSLDDKRGPLITTTSTTQVCLQKKLFINIPFTKFNITQAV
jgi:hypothetical protein